MGKDVNKVTEYTYKWNNKTQAYIPTIMRVKINEMIEGLPEPDTIETITDDDSKEAVSTNPTEEEGPKNGSIEV